MDTKSKLQRIKDILQSKGVVMSTRLNPRLYFEQGTFIWSVGYHNVTIIQGTFEMDLSLTSLSDSVLDKIIKNLENG